MNNFTRKTVFSLLLATSLCTLNAQKIAHLRLDSLIGLMPETKVATELAQKYLESLKGEITSMQAEMDSKYKDYLANEPSMGEMVKKSKQADLQQLEARIQDFQGKAEMDFQKKQAELTIPIMNKAKKGIEAVAKEMGYKYVLDTGVQSATVLFNEDSDDILEAVKKKLDGMPPALIPGTAQKAENQSKPAPAQPNKAAKPKK